MAESQKNNTPEKWTEIEHLTEWDEEFYHVYTAKKHGKWVMLKTLKPEYADNPEYRSMIEKEFDVRYNLSHPNIVMINDFEDVPGVGRSIICDDVYGVSLRKLIDEGKVEKHHIDQIATRLVSAIDYIQTNHIVHHPIRPETIIFTENINNLKLIDVGFDQRRKLSPAETTEDIRNFGRVLDQALKASGLHDANLRRIADRCMSATRPFRSVEQLRMHIEQRSINKIMLVALIFLTIMVVILALVAAFPVKKSAAAEPLIHATE